MGVSGAEFDVMAYNYNGDTFAEKIAEDFCQVALEIHVQPLGWFVQQQDIGLRQQHFC
ncbi:hypothetical protein SDC9_146381 [bioreactor metagenome]|uniref:Uncharacterized protein n=1 Tax=bioreactor metagenome TaxID=1076179 RepID=A0A645EBH7_9ZZZZ